MLQKPSEANKMGGIPHAHLHHRTLDPLAEEGQASL